MQRFDFFWKFECGFCLVFGLFMDFGVKGLWIVLNAFNCGGKVCFFLFLMKWIFGSCSYQLVLTGLLLFSAKKK